MLSASRSIIVTGNPLSNAATVMPAPIVPPPTTPILSNLRGFARLASGTLALARSAKKAWIMPLDCSEERHSKKLALSNARPSAKGVSSAAVTHSMIFIGAS